jgi:serine/threonine-protein kinase
LRRTYAQIIRVSVTVLALALVAVAVAGCGQRTPDYAGMTIEEAERAAAEIGLELGDVAYDARSDEATWTVISQVPAAGEPLGDAKELKITVAGPAPTDVPPVVGLKLREATLSIEEAGLVLGSVTESEVTTASAGTVISQAFPQGEAVPAGSVIALVVSAGPEAVPIPDVLAASAAEAKRKLAEAGFDVETEQREDPSPPGTVLEQDPGPGQELEPGSTVRIVESKGVVSEEYRILGTWTATDNGDVYRYRGGNTAAIPGDVVRFEISDGVLTIEYADWGLTSYDVTWISDNEFRWTPRSGGDTGGTRTFRRTQ